MENKTKFVTSKVRLLYPSIYKATGFQGNKEKFSILILIDKIDNKTLESIENAVKAANEEAKEKYGKAVTFKSPLRDGDLEKPDNELYKGKLFLSAKSDRKPMVLDRNKVPMLEDDGSIYSGVWGQIVGNMYPYNVSGNKGISAGLQAVRKVADGERVGGKSFSVSDFDDSGLDVTDDWAEID